MKSDEIERKQLQQIKFERKTQQMEKLSDLQERMT